MIFSQNGMRQAEKERRKFYSRIQFILDPGKKIPKKIAKKLKKLKNLFPTLFLAKTGRDRPRKRGKNFTPEFRSYSTRQEISEKNSKKIKKPRSDIIFSQNGMRQAEKEIKKFYSRIPFILDSGKKIPKKIGKKLKKI